MGVDEAGATSLNGRCRPKLLLLLLLLLAVVVRRRWWHYRARTHTHMPCTLLVFVSFSSFGRSRSSSKHTQQIPH